MTITRILVDHDFYDVLSTDEYEHQINETYVYLSNAVNEFGYKKYPDDYADKWLDKIDKFVENLKIPRNLEIVNSEHFSDTYSHVQVSDTETTVFLLVKGNQIYLATCGWSRLLWHEIAQGKELEIEKQIQELKDSRTKKQN